jgi:hypothetical protein
MHEFHTFSAERETQNSCRAELGSAIFSPLDGSIVLADRLREKGGRECFCAYSHHHELATTRRALGFRRPCVARPVQLIFEQGLVARYVSHSVPCGCRRGFQGMR